MSDEREEKTQRDDHLRMPGEAGYRRRAYAAPELVEYGTVAKLTQTGSGSIFRFHRHAGHDDVRAKRVRLDAACAAAVALAVARVWLVLAPGAALRWGTRIAERDVTGRGSLTDPPLARDRRDPRSESHARIRDLSRAVIAVGVRRPFSATCLEQSLALVILLSFARIPAHLLVGVTRAESTFRAHAWVACGGAVVLGGGQAQGLTPLLPPTRSASPSTAASSCPG